MKKIIFLFAAIVALASCTITKRHYSPGYYFEFRKRELAMLHPAKEMERCVSSQEEYLFELQASSDLQSIEILQLKNVELQCTSNIRLVNDSLKKNRDSLSSRNNEVYAKNDTLDLPNSSGDYYKAKEKVNPKAAIGFGLTVLGISTAFFAPYLVFYLTLIGVLFSYLGYKEIKRHGGRGEKLAKWGMAIPLGAFALVIVFALIFLLAYGIALA